MRVAICVVAVLGAAAPVAAQDKKPDVRATLTGHRGGVGAVAFGPKGDLIATGAGNGVVRIWNAKTGEVVARIDDQTHGEARVKLMAWAADGKHLSAASKQAVVVWDMSDPKVPKIRYEDGHLATPAKIGTVTGDGRRVYFLASLNNVFLLRTYTFATRDDSRAAVPEKFSAVTLAAIPDTESGLVAVYGGAADERPAIALLGLGDPKLLTDDVPKPAPGTAPHIAFSPDGKWLVVAGESIAYWRVPGSQVVTGKPKLLEDVAAVAVAVGPGNRLAYATAPEEGKKVTIRVVELGGDTPKPIADFATNIERVSALAWAPDGTLAVADDAEGAVQLWALGEEKK